jgi:23S rRNA pseudouridine2605 synthase
VLEKRQRLSKALAQGGIASRRAAEELIAQGLVKVNGKVVTIPQELVDFEKDTILYLGKRVMPESKVYYLVHKPVGYICTSAPSKKRAIDLIGPTNNRLYTIGRLDKETSGLIIITNDGDFANKVMHPSSRIPKEYLVKVDKEVQHEHLVTMSEGMWIEGGFVKPLSIRKVRRGTYKVIICDGRKHEVRRLAEKAGLTVKDLCRIRIGELVLGGLAAGAFRELSAREKELLLSGQRQKACKRSEN